MDILSMQNVSLSFGSTRALDGLSFAVKEGEIFGFLGPSGAGKTTTIKLLTRQLRPGAGEIAVFGAPIARLDSAAYEQIGILSDNSGVYERMSVYENMKLFADLRGLPASRIGEVLEKVGLADAGKRVAKKLSKGMRQRLILAMAVLHRPRLLFLDEPTTYLDMAHQLEVLELLQTLNRDEGKTIALVIHELNLAARFSDWMIALKSGAIRGAGTPAEVMTPALLREVFGLDALIEPDPWTGLPSLVSYRLAGEEH